jgi:hypothetical protein
VTPLETCPGSFSCSSCSVPPARYCVQAFLEGEQTMHLTWARDNRQAHPAWLGQESHYLPLEDPREQEGADCGEPILSPASGVRICRDETGSVSSESQGNQGLLNIYCLPRTGHSFVHLTSPNLGKVRIIIPVIQVRKLRYREIKQLIQSHPAGGRTGELIQPTRL